jgi:hypothetical protein
MAATRDAIAHLTTTRIAGRAMASPMILEMAFARWRA